MTYFNTEILSTDFVDVWENSVCSYNGKLYAIAESSAVQHYYVCEINPSNQVVNVIVDLGTSYAAWRISVDEGHICLIKDVYSSSLYDDFLVLYMFDIYGNAVVANKTICTYEGVKNNTNSFEGFNVLIKDSSIHYVWYKLHSVFSGSWSYDARLYTAYSDFNGNNLGIQDRGVFDIYMGWNTRIAIVASPDRLYYAWKAKFNDGVNSMCLASSALDSSDWKNTRLHSLDIDDHGHVEGLIIDTNNAYTCSYRIDEDGEHIMCLTTCDINGENVHYVDFGKTGAHGISCLCGIAIYKEKLLYGFTVYDNEDWDDYVYTATSNMDGSNFIEEKRTEETSYLFGFGVFDTEVFYMMSSGWDYDYIYYAIDVSLVLQTGKNYVLAGECSESDPDVTMTYNGKWYKYLETLEAFTKVTHAIAGESATYEFGGATVTFLGQEYTYLASGITDPEAPGGFGGYLPDVSRTVESLADREAYVNFYYTYPALARVGQPVWSKKVITWKDVANAETYVVKLYNASNELLDTQTVAKGAQRYDYTDLIENYLPAGSYTATVQAMPEVT